MLIDAKGKKGVPPASRRLFSGESLRIRSRGRLPHWESTEGIYFVTFGLFDSLPRAVVRSFEAERENIVGTARQMDRALSATERRRLSQLFSQRIESYLNTCSGSCFLRHPRIAKIVADSLRYFDGERYRLFAWCVMPNHVHIVFRPGPGNRLSPILHSWKSFTAKAANRILRRSGEFWRREYYDHLVRNPEEFTRVVEYVLQNPSKAGLKDWPWVQG